MMWSTRRAHVQRVMYDVHRLSCLLLLTRRNIPMCAIVLHDGIPGGAGKGPLLCFMLCACSAGTETCMLPRRSAKCSDFGSSNKRFSCSFQQGL